jgi:hypothetical protein
MVLFLVARSLDDSPRAKAPGTPALISVPLSRRCRPDPADADVSDERGANRAGEHDHVTSELHREGFAAGRHP